MDGGPGAELPGDRLPLAAGAQHMQDAIEHPTKWHRRPTTGPRRFLRRQDLLADRPQVVRRDQIAVRVIGPAVHRRDQPGHPLDPVPVQPSRQNSATFGGIRPLPVPPDLLDEVGGKAKGHRSSHRWGSLR